MRLHPAMPARLDDTCSNTGQVKGGNRNNQQKPFHRFGRSELAGLELEAPRFRIQKGSKSAQNARRTRPGS